jgi:tetratricopeptide (TPR) repeat protein
MARDRIDVLKSFIEKNPNDPFSYYGLAMEYARRGRVDDAINVFSHLLEKYPDYVPTYYHAAMALTRAGDNEQARATMRKGIDVAERLGNIHAKNELQDALAQLP